MTSLLQPATRRARSQICRVHLRRTCLLVPQTWPQSCTVDGEAHNRFSRLCYPSIRTLHRAGLLDEMAASDELSEGCSLSVSVRVPTTRVVRKTSSAPFAEYQVEVTTTTTTSTAGSAHSVAGESTALVHRALARARALSTDVPKQNPQPPTTTTASTTKAVWVVRPPVIKLGALCTSLSLLANHVPTSAPRLRSAGRPSRLSSTSSTGL